GLEDVSKYPNLIAALINNGWNEVNIKKLIGGNLLRAMRAMEAVRDSMVNDLPLEENMPRDNGGEANNTCRTYYYKPDG
uniref:membrane dipeptidase n=1 Tax=Salmonella sp. s54395 TaxID=3159664 RepID=UPI0039813303